MFHKIKFKKIDNKKIELAIADFEDSVDFELVPVISERSSFIEHTSWVISLTLIVIVISGIDYWLQDSWINKTFIYIAAALVSVILGKLLSQVDVLNRFLISKSERSRQVTEKAQRIFSLKRLHETKSHHAILLYVSLMERQIVILPDPQMKLEGVNELQVKLLQIMRSGFANKQYEQAFLDAISYLKTELAGRFPQTNKNHENQLPNKLIWWSV